MRIGVVARLNPSDGGVYQYSLTMLQALGGSDHAPNDSFVLFAGDSDHALLANLKPPVWSIRSLPPDRQAEPPRALTALRRLVGEGPHRQAWRWLRHRVATVPRKDPDTVVFRPDAHRWFRDCGTDLMLYPVPGPLAFEAGISYVMAIHDLEHRVHPEFPEVASNGEWEFREYYFRNGSRYATLLIADSEVGKQHILEFYGPYGVTEDRVKILPFLPACYLAHDVPAEERHRVRTTYRLPARYLFYPAQFWAHKNHAGLVRALGFLKHERRLTIDLVLAGSHSGDLRKRVFRDVTSLSHRLGVAPHVHYLGYVPDADMSAIYAEATALVMPTFFGPTNIPVTEAWAFGCPVVTSDIPGVREHVGDAAILADPGSLEELAEGIHRIWTDASARARLVERGRQRLSAYTPDDYRRRLMAILDEAKERVRSETPRIAIPAGNLA